MTEPYRAVTVSNIRRSRRDRLRLAARSDGRMRSEVEQRGSCWMGKALMLNEARRSRKALMARQPDERASATDNAGSGDV